MKTRALLLALPLLAVAGCRDNRASIQLQAMCAPSSECRFSDSCDAQYIGFPTIDASQTGRLWLFFEVANQLEDNADSAIGKTNTNDAHVDQVVVKYEGIALPEAVSDVGSYQVPAGGTAVISAEAVPAALNAGAALTAFAPTTAYRTFVANVRVRGYLDDGSRFETGDFAVGVRVCTGCLTAATGLCAAGAPTCPPESNGQLPIACP